MKASAFFMWLGGYLLFVLVTAGGLYGFYKVQQVLPFQTLGGRTFYGLVSAAAIAWCIHGLTKIARGEARRWVKFLQVSVVSLAMLGGIGSVYFALFSVTPYESDFGAMLGGVWVLAWLFILLVELAIALLSRGGAVLGVAKTVLDEALRMKMAMVFVGMMLLVLPILPFVFSEDTPLRYRVQTFMTYSLTLMGVLLSMMTLFLSCATLSWEIETKQIFTLATKPIGRGAHLLGKWIGIMVLNTILLTLGATAVYGFTVFYLARLPARDYYDRQALTQEILTARIAARPRPETPFEEQAQQVLAKEMENDPGMFEQLGRDQAARVGIRNPTQEVAIRLGQERRYSDLREEVEKEWRILYPGEVGVYIFEGLKEAKTQAQLTVKTPEGQDVRVVQLHYKVDASTNLPDDKAMVGLAINGRPLRLQQNNPFVEFSTSSAQSLPIPSEVIADDGTVRLEIFNPMWEDEKLRSTLTFSSRESMELLYQAGSFTPNYIRSNIATLFKLAFLAMLGLMTATFLSFPVAVVLALLIFLCAMTSPYLLDSVRSFGNNPQDLLGWFTFILKGIGWSVSTMLSKFAAFRSTVLIVDGRMFGWKELASCALWIGVVWTGLTCFVGWLIYRKRELAKVQV